MSEASSYRKKPVVIQAVQWTFIGPMTPDFEGSWPAIKEFAGDAVRKDPGDRTRILVKTLEGELAASLNDWILRGVKGEFYPCKPDVFRATYDPATVPAWGELPIDRSSEPILQYFEHQHLPPHLQEVSRPFGELADLLLRLPRCAERTVAFRKLLEGKDAAVRAKLFKAL